MSQAQPSFGIVTQARMGSSRLPGKVLRRVGAQTLLALHLRRLAWAELPIVVATSVEPADDAIVAACVDLGVACHRGPEADVLRRMTEAAAQADFDHVVRVTADCPLVDGHLVAAGVAAYRAAGGLTAPVYLATGLQRPYPRGLDFEVFSFEQLALADRLATAPHEREHVTPYLYRVGAEAQQIDFECYPQYAHLRLTVDTTEDLSLVERLVAEHHADALPAAELLALLDRLPALQDLNRDVKQKSLTD